MSHHKNGAATPPSVVIVGAGPSGLATAACLRHLSIHYAILEREDCFASLWQKYAYDRIHLHLAKQFSHLPLKPIPPNYPTYLSKSQLVKYLSEYMEHFEIEPMYNARVEHAHFDGSVWRWTITARRNGGGAVEEFFPRFLVVATGSTCDAYVPKDIDGLEGFQGEVLHSTRFKNGREFRGKSVLVVGCGNSGMEIALDLAENGAKTSIVVRSPGFTTKMSSNSDGRKLHETVTNFRS